MHSNFSQAVSLQRVCLLRPPHICPAIARYVIICSAYPSPLTHILPSYTPLKYRPSDHGTVTATAHHTPPAAPNPLPSLPGAPAIPPKLLQKITSRQYIDLADLLPDQLHSNPSSADNTVVIIPESSFATQRRKRRSISDISTRIEVYSTYMAVLGAAFPSQFPELVACQLLIMSAFTRAFKTLSVN